MSTQAAEIYTLAGPPLLTEIRGTIPVRVEGCAQVVEPRLRQSLWRLTEDRHSPSHGRAETGPCCTHSPVVDWDLQAQFIHEELHDVIAFPMKLQSSPVVLRGPLKTRKADRSDFPLSACPCRLGQPSPGTRTCTRLPGYTDVAHLPGPSELRLGYEDALSTHVTCKFTM